MFNRPKPRIPLCGYINTPIYPTLKSIIFAIECLIRCNEGSSSFHTFDIIAVVPLFDLVFEIVFLFSQCIIQPLVNALFNLFMYRSYSDNIASVKLAVGDIERCL